MIGFDGKVAGVQSVLGSNNLYSPSSAVQAGKNSSLDSAISNAMKVSQDNSERMSLEAAQQRAWTEQQNRLANEFNMKEAQKNRDWQEYMSNSAHQREVKDLLAAGLNPVLSAGGGHGAATTSGSSANAVSGSGSTGQVDTSANSSIVTLLSSFLSAQTQLESQRLSAASNQAIADKNNASARLIAEIYGMFGLKEAGIYSDASRYSADTHASASRYGSDSARAAQMYSADSSRASAKYSADSSRAASQYASNTALQNALIAAQASYHATDSNAKTQLSIQDQREAQETYIKQNFPSNEWGLISSFINSLSEGAGIGGLQDIFSGIFGKNKRSTYKRWEDPKTGRTGGGR